MYSFLDVVQPTIKNARQSLNSFYFILFHFTFCSCSSSQQKLLLTHTCPVKNPPIVYTLHSNETISLESILRSGFIFLTKRMNKSIIDEQLSLNKFFSIIAKKDKKFTLKCHRGFTL